MVPPAFKKAMLGSDPEIFCRRQPNPAQQHVTGERSKSQPVEREKVILLGYDAPTSHVSRYLVPNESIIARTDVHITDMRQIDTSLSNQMLVL